MQINADIANCATGRYLRRIGRRASFYSRKFAIRKNEIESIPNSQGEEKGGVETRSDFENMPGYRWFLSIGRPNVNKANLLKKIRRSKIQKHFLRSRGLIFLKKAIRKLNGGRQYRIRFPILDWAENGIAIGTHWDPAGSWQKRQYAPNRYFQLPEEANYRGKLRI